MFHRQRRKCTPITANLGSSYLTNHLDFDLPTLSDGSAATDELAEVKAALILVVDWLIRQDLGASEWLAAEIRRSTVNGTSTRPSSVRINASGPVTTNEAAANVSAT